MTKQIKEAGTAVAQIEETALEPADGQVEKPPPSAAFLAMSSGDRDSAARLLASEGGSAGDPVDVEAALAWDPVALTTGGILALVWIYAAITLL